MLKQQRDSNWPNRIFTNMREPVLGDEFPDDNVTEMEMDDDLRKNQTP